MPIFDRLSSRPLYAAALVALAAFCVYLTTLSPSVDFIDAGELATDCYTLGICHPTGYPLFTIIGYLFSHLPVAASVIVRLNLMAALFTALGAGGLTFLAYELYRFWMPQRAKKSLGNAKVDSRSTAGTKQVGGTSSGKAVQAKKMSLNPAAPPSPIPAETEESIGSAQRSAWSAALLAGLAAAFSQTWWEQSTSVEVYPVHLFMVPLVLTFFLRMLRREASVQLGLDARLFALLLGLSFGNHMTTVLLAPACLFLYFGRFGFRSEAWYRIVRLAPFFLAGLAVYLYLPLRSSMYPIMDWGHPASIGAFFRHVTGGQYKIWMFSSAGAAAKQWSYFWHCVPGEFTVVGGLLALVGVWALISPVVLPKRFFSSPAPVFSWTKKFSIRILIMPFTLLLFFGCLLYSINYDIHDIDSYFLLAYLTMALWAGVGAIFLGNALVPAGGTRRAWPAYLIAGAAVLLAALELSTNYSEADESGNHFVENTTKNLLLNLPPNAIIFSTQWDFWVSGAFYYQLVEKIRPDVLVIDKAMLRDRPWYYAELEQRAPDIFRRAKPEEDAFLQYLWAFDNGQKFNSAGIAPAYQAFTTALVERNLDRPIFVTQEMIDQRDELFAPNMKFIPAGVAYRLLPRDTVLDVALPTLRWDDQQYRKRNYYTDDPRILLALPLANYAQVLYSRGQTSLAGQFLDAALKFTPDLQAPLDDMNERDLSIANAANEKFEEMAALKTYWARK